jgi:ethanolamine kinase
MLIAAARRVGLAATRQGCALSTGRCSIPLLYEDLKDGDTNVSALKDIVLGVLEARGETVDRSLLEFSIVSGGITNKLFKCEAPNTSYTVRVYGGEGMINREVETETFIALADAKVGKEYIGEFGNGRVEGWIGNADALVLEDMARPEIFRLTAQELAKLHRMKMPPKLAEHYGEPSLWSQLHSWLDQAQSSVHLIGEKWGPATASRFDRIHNLYLGSTDANGRWTMDRVEKELVYLESTIPRDLSPAVFAHNDLLAGNILLNKVTGAVHLIDFEYGGMNYRGFDIANHWNEWAGGTQTEMNGKCEYERFPTPGAQYAFCEAYLSEENGDVPPEIDTVMSLMEESNKFVLLNHWFWGLWAVNQVVLEGTEHFDYLTYTESRAEQYFKTKEA